MDYAPQLRQPSSIPLTKPTRGILRHHTRPCRVGNVVQQQQNNTWVCPRDTRVQMGRPPPPVRIVHIRHQRYSLRRMRPYSTWKHVEDPRNGPQAVSTLVDAVGEHATCGTATHANSPINTHTRYRCIGHMPKVCAASFLAAP